MQILVLYNAQYYTKKHPLFGTEGAFYKVSVFRTEL